MILQHHIGAGASNNPVALIPAYKPEPLIIDVCKELLLSGAFQGLVCVNDGSGPDFDWIFEELSKLGAKIFCHHVNLGKGMALRSGLNYIACSFPSALGVVTLDADGQHLATDVIQVAKTLSAHPACLVMGCRGFSQNVPFRSKIGNLATRFIMRFVGGVKISDTQTGLRGIPISFVQILLRLATSGYDFEMDMLIKSREAGVPFMEVPITTVYVEGNRTSHFRPLIDSVKIYFVLLRHTGNAMATAAIDYGVFAILFTLGYPLLGAIIGGRTLAGLFNFYVAKNFVFKSKSNIWVSLGGYVALVVGLMLFSYSAIALILKNTGLSPYVAKFFVEFGLFFVSFSVQRVFVFNSVAMRLEKTDWDTYYRKRKSRGSLTRKISENLILAAIERQRKQGIQSITELGGGDSCFYKAFRLRHPDAKYLVVDKSGEGVAKFLQEHGSNMTAAVCADLLASPDLPLADLVFSVGLIEHFDVAGTAQLIAAHFRVAVQGGTILMTYPTPTFSYRLIRGMAELFGIWRFPDERPLLFDEVGAEVRKHGIILEKKSNWFIGLTQEIVVAKKL